MQLILKIISAFKDMFFIFCLLCFKGLEFQPVIKFNFVFQVKNPAQCNIDKVLVIYLLFKIFISILIYFKI